MSEIVRVDKFKNLHIPMFCVVHYASGKKMTFNPPIPDNVIRFMDVVGNKCGTTDIVGHSTVETFRVDSPDVAHKYSKVIPYKYGNTKHNFRYNFETKELECVYAPKAETVEEMRKDTFHIFDDDLKSYDNTGFCIIDHEPLSEENWRRDKWYYIDKMCEDIACTVAEGV